VELQAAAEDARRIGEWWQDFLLLAILVLNSVWYMAQKVWAGLLLVATCGEINLFKRPAKIRPSGFVLIAIEWVTVWTGLHHEEVAYASLGALAATLVLVLLFGHSDWLVAALVRHREAIMD
jgi:hypothetical protein